MKVNYVTHVYTQGININTMCPKYIQSRSTKSHLLQVYPGALANIETVIEYHVCTIAFKRYPCTYYLIQGSCAMCSKFEINSSTLESQYLSECIP